MVTRGVILKTIGISIATCGFATAFYIGIYFGSPPIKKLKRISDFNPNDPGIAMMLVKDGKKVVELEAGMANMKSKKLISNQTNFNLASISKQFTAYAIFMLEQAGQVDREAPLSRYIKDLPNWADSVRIKHLLSHTSGIGSKWTQCALLKPLTNGDVLTNLRNETDLKFPPGDHFEYSNNGYVVLASVVEAVTGKSFPSFVEERIFKTLGMNASKVLTEQSESLIIDRAIGYNSWPFQNTLDMGSCSYLTGDGAIYSNLNDYLLWIKEIESPTLVDPIRFKEALSSGAQIRDGVAYSYGWGISRVGGKMQLEHRGTWLGFQSYVVGSPDTHSWLVLFSNSSDLDRAGLVSATLKEHQKELGVVLEPKTVSGF